MNLQFDRGFVPVNKEDTNEVVLDFRGSMCGLMDLVTDRWFWLTRDEAVQVAKDIIVHYEVPFCNRVPGAGTVGESDAK